MFTDAFKFFTEFVRHPRQLGSIIPSSGFLKKRITRIADVAQAQLVVELGPGSGGTTRAILQAMPANATLLSIELNEGLYQLTGKINDSRYIAHHGDAAQLAGILSARQLPQPDVVISGIPFSTMDTAVATGILDAIHQQLAPGGRFVAYQVSDQVDRLNTFYEPSARSMEVEWLNIPPLRIWRWLKR